MSSPFPLVLTPQKRPALPSCFLFFKKDIFILLKWLHRKFHCDIFMYYNLNWFIPSVFLLSTLVLSPLLVVISTGLLILYSLLILV
jgi:hypothetical protein